jgi:tryptophan halogenase
MYNDQISTLDEIKEDVKNIFDRFGLNPSEKTLELHFNNYYRKQNFVGRSAYSGNTSFFLEPLEATSIGFMDQIQRMAMGHWFHGDSVEMVNDFYIQAIQEIENIIMLHYFAGSKYNTPFWDYAKDRGQKCMDQAVKNPRFVEFYNNSKNYDFRNCLTTPIDKMMYGSWDQRIMNMNLKSLGLINKIDTLLNNGV